MRSILRLQLPLSSACPVSLRSPFSNCCSALLRQDTLNPSLIAIEKASQLQTAPSITTGAGRENVSRNFRGGKKRRRKDCSCAGRPGGRRGKVCLYLRRQGCPRTRPARQKSFWVLAAALASDQML